MPSPILRLMPSDGGNSEGASPQQTGLQSMLSYCEELSLLLDIVAVLLDLDTHATAVLMPLACLEMETLIRNMSDLQTTWMPTLKGSLKTGLTKADEYEQATFLDDD